MVFFWIPEKSVDSIISKYANQIASLIALTFLQGLKVPIRQTTILLFFPLSIPHNTNLRSL